MFGSGITKYRQHNGCNSLIVINMYIGIFISGNSIKHNI